MADEQSVLEVLERRAKRVEGRREFFRKSAGFAAGLAGGAVLAACSSDSDDAVAQTPPPSGGGSAAPTDVEILNFALNLEYLEAQFYSFAALGQGLPAASLTGAGTQGAVTGGRRVNFTDPVVAQYAREIAQDEIAHVNFLRSALGGAAVAQPAINISGDATGAFTVAARAAGVIGPNDTFDPYASDENFLLGAYIFEDVGVTAYKGASPLISNKTFLEAAAGILAAEAYHAGLVRTVLYAKGVTAPALRTIAGQISDLRGKLDGATDLDQVITGPADTSNIVPLDANGIAFSRSPGQVLNIVYGTPTSVRQGLFFPAGVNGALAMSAAS